MANVLPQHLQKLFYRIAKHVGRAADQPARETVPQWIEDAEDVCEAERVLRRVRSGRECTYTLDELATRLGL